MKCYSSLYKYSKKSSKLDLQIEWISGWWIIVIIFTNIFSDDYFITNLLVKLLSWFSRIRISFSRYHCHRNRVHCHRNLRKYGFLNFRKSSAISEHLPPKEGWLNTPVGFQCGLCLGFEGFFQARISREPGQSQPNSNSKGRQSVCIWKTEILLLFILLVQ